MKKDKRKKSTKKKAQKKKVQKKVSAKKKAAGKATAKARKAPRERVARGSQGGLEEPVRLSRARAQSGKQSGDLQGLSNVAGADSESVEELIEEGDAFEAGVVQGVEEADGSDRREVHTREVPEDDVPEEYLDKD